MKETYIEKKFSKASLAVIEQANLIIDEYQAEGYTLTLRQLYYQFVSRDLIQNKQSEYKRLGSIINDARLAGLIDWESLEDRTRNLRRLSTWNTPSDILQSAAQSFKVDLWADQGNYCEVWVEKDALVGVIEPVCERLRVPFFACRGYTSQSEQWNAGKRLLQRVHDGKTVTIFHLGDHDPSGIDMTRDNQERLEMFTGAGEAEGSLYIVRLALNIDQVRKYKPPPNPAKTDDSRFESYAAKYGNKSWELDALDPKTIDGLITANVQELINGKAWAKSMSREKDGVKTLERFAAGAA